MIKKQDCLDNPTQEAKINKAQEDLDGRLKREIGSGAESVTFPIGMYSINQHARDGLRKQYESQGGWKVREYAEPGDRYSSDPREQMDVLVWEIR